jgi:hypothetical protein
VLSTFIYWTWSHDGHSLEEKGRNMEKHRGAVLTGAGGGGLTHPSLGGGGRLEGKLGRERSRAGEETSAGKGAWAGEKQGDGAETSVVKTGWIFSSLVAVVATELGGPGRGHKRGVALATLMGW